MWPLAPAVPQPCLDAGGSDEPETPPCWVQHVLGAEARAGEPPEAAPAELLPRGAWGHWTSPGSTTASPADEGKAAGPRPCPQPRAAPARPPGALQALVPSHYPPKLELVLQMRRSLSLTSKV